jgi:hypothetical protein
MKKNQISLSLISNLDLSVHQQYFPHSLTSWDWQMRLQKIACGFGAGVSKTGNICGAVSGAVLVIGLKYGKQAPYPSTQPSRRIIAESLA